MCIRDSCYEWIYERACTTFNHTDVYKRQRGIIATNDFRKTCMYSYEWSPLPRVQWVIRYDRCWQLDYRLRPPADHDWYCQRPIPAFRQIISFNVVSELCLHWKQTLREPRSMNRKRLNYYYSCVSSVSSAKPQKVPLVSNSTRVLSIFIQFCLLSTFEDNCNYTLLRKGYY